MNTMKRSRHWADVLSWIQKCVQSCETQKQCNTCFNLTYNFEKLYTPLLPEALERANEVRNSIWDKGFKILAKNLETWES